MSQQIGTVGTDRTKSLQVHIEEYKGITGVDVREWYANSTGKMCPTTKGIRIQLSMVSQLVTLLEQAEALLVKSGQMKSPGQK